MEGRSLHLRRLQSIHVFIRKSSYVKSQGLCSSRGSRHKAVSHPSSQLGLHSKARGHHARTKCPPCHRLCAACAARPAPAKGLRRQLARARGPRGPHRAGSLPVGLLLSREQRRQVTPALRAVPARGCGQAAPSPRAQVPSGPRHGPTCESGRPQASSSASSAGPRRPCRNRGPPGLPQLGQPCCRGAALRSGVERHRPGLCSPPAARDGLRPPPLLRARLAVQTCASPAPRRERRPGTRDAGVLSRSLQRPALLWVSACFGWDLPACGLQLRSVVHPLHTLCLRCLPIAVGGCSEEPEIFLFPDWSISIPQSICLLSINT